MGCFNFASKTPQRLCRAGPVVVLALTLVLGLLVGAPLVQAQLPVPTNCQVDIQGANDQGTQQRERSRTCHRSGNHARLWG